MTDRSNNPDSRFEPLDRAVSVLFNRLGVRAPEEAFSAEHLAAALQVPSTNQLELFSAQLESRLNQIEHAILVSRDLTIHELAANINALNDLAHSCLTVIHELGAKLDDLEDDVHNDIKRMLTLPAATLFISTQMDLLIANEDVGLIAYLSRHGLDIEPPVRAILTRLVEEGDTAIDIGANYGLHTIPLGLRVGPNGLVIAVEPHPQCFHYLLQNCHLNGLASRIHAVPAAVSSESGVGTLHAADHSPHSSFFESLAGSSPEATTCDLVTIDDLTEDLAGPLKVVKMDIEGGEPLAWEGARTTRVRYPDTSFILEWSSENLSAAGSSRATLIRSLSGEGYRVLGITDCGLIEMHDLGLRDHAVESIFVSRDEDAIHRAQIALATSRDG